MQFFKNLIALQFANESFNLKQRKHKMFNCKRDKAASFESRNHSKRNHVFFLQKILWSEYNKVQGSQKLVLHNLDQ